jgi:DMSO/TMAO reductase YedYZ molybdopterin-dependent catalytic subunit
MTRQDPADQGRVPPGQSVTGSFPVYSFAGNVDITTDRWSLSIWGAVGRDTVLGWEQFLALGPVTDTLDFHCVTGWSRLGDVWTGIPSSAILALAQPDSAAAAVMVHCADGYTTNILLADFARDGVMLAYRFGGQPLAREHGFPVRMLVPHLYAYKAAKWVIGLEFLVEDSPGYWEQRGYSDRGDPWLEDRYSP